MANRGCTIVIKLLGGSSGNGETEDISLPVALHSPLQVLKEQLLSLVGINPADQVLILCDLSDPERNSDKLLSGSEFLSLRNCGITNGSILTLHALGMSAERKQQITKEALSKKQIEQEVQQETLVLNTEVTAADANHSYNGIVFDVSSNGPYEVDVLSVSLAGMLGRVRVYARDRPWEEDKPVEAAAPHWWAHREGLSKEHWVLVADQVCRPSWDKPIEIKFNQKVSLLPYERRALYCHSGLPDDLGIQYQSYPEKSVFAEDQYISLHTGLGHTGSRPFDDTHGWYRGNRGLAGNVRYHARYMGWTIFDHNLFPEVLKEAVMTMLLCQQRDKQLVCEDSKEHAAQSSSSSSSSSSWSPPQKQQTSSHLSTLLSTSPGGYLTRSRSNSSSSNKSTHSSSAMSAIRHVTTSIPSPSSLFRNTRIMSSSSTRDSLARSVSAQAVGPLLLCKLHVHLIYNILEYMHWDWFVECEESNMFATYDEDEDEEEEGYGSSGRKKKSVYRRVTAAASHAAQTVRQAAIAVYLNSLGMGVGGGGTALLAHFGHGAEAVQGYINDDYLYHNQDEDDDEDDDDDDEEYEDGDGFEEYDEDDDEEDDEEEEEDQGDLTGVSAHDFNFMDVDEEEEGAVSGHSSGDPHAHSRREEQSSSSDDENDEEGEEEDDNEHL